MALPIGFSKGGNSGYANVILFESKFAGYSSTMLRVDTRYPAKAEYRISGQLRGN